MRQKRWQRALALGVVLAGVAAGCGSDADDEAASTTAQAGAATPAAAGSGGAVKLANTVAGEDPAAWGVKDKKLTGPGGFEVDLSKCPANWKDAGGITDTEIRLGATGIFSGVAAASSGFVLGAEAYYNYINATEGGVNGKKLTYTYKDNGYTAGQGKAATDELLETANLFAFSAHTGSPIVLATYDKLNESCLPNVYSVGAHPAFADPVNHPWTTGTWLSYDIEANLWADYILAKYGKGTTVAALAWGNEFGTIYKNVFTRVAKEKGLNFVKVETHANDAATVTNEMTTLASSGADVFIAMTGANPAIQTMQYMAGSSWKPKERIVSSVNTALSQFTPVGAGADGWMMAGGPKDINDPASANDPFLKQWAETLKKANLDYASNGNMAKGAEFAWPTVENLKRAAQMPGGLTKSNFILAVRSFSAQHPMWADGIKFELNGSKDGATIEGSQFVRYTVAAGQEKGTFVASGSIVDSNGKNPNCAWDGKECK
ncbi:MAG: ABC transporter substrate-binding protein [Acidimicrobiales bacterium]